MVPVFILTLGTMSAGPHGGPPWSPTAPLFSEHLLSLCICPSSSSLLALALRSPPPPAALGPSKWQVGLRNWALQPGASDAPALLSVSVFLFLVENSAQANVPSVCVTCGSDSETWAQPSWLPVHSYSLCGVALSEAILSSGGISCRSCWPVVPLLQAHLSGFRKAEIELYFYSYFLKFLKFITDLKANNLLKVTY